jgi:hypothetical protein
VKPLPIVSLDLQNVVATADIGGQRLVLAPPLEPLSSSGPVLCLSVTFPGEVTSVGCGAKADILSKGASARFEDGVDGSHIVAGYAPKGAEGVRMGSRSGEVSSGFYVVSGPVTERTVSFSGAPAVSTLDLGPNRVLPTP